MNDLVQDLQSREGSIAICNVPSETEQGCCSTTNEGDSICLVPQDGQASTCSCQQNAYSHSQYSIEDLLLSEGSSESSLSIDKESPDLWKRMRGSAVFVVACVTSPCCTPLVVPLGLTLIAGTPAAIWLSANIGWVYGGLTLISILSFVLGFRWLGHKSAAKRVEDTTHQFISPSISKLEHS